MKREQRYDRYEIKAKRADNGHIYDTPVITRTGIFLYRNPDGTSRRELRLPEEVFRADSLASLRGIPVTDGHVGTAGANNAHANIGTVLDAGRQDGGNLIADIVIHNPAAVDAGNKDLSCGYVCDLDETAGEWQGQPYDAVQRNIVYNHLAVVPKGRAGNARLNLDAADFTDPQPEKGKPMKKIRLDNGIEYDVPPEVAAEHDKLKAEKHSAQTAQAQAEAERDDAKAKLAQAEKAAETAQAEAMTAARERVKLEQTAAEHGVEVKADAADRDIKIAVVQKLRQDGADLGGKPDAYVQAAFDLAVADAAKHARNANAAQQRADAAGQPDRQTQNGGSAEAARAAMIAAQRKGAGRE